MKFESKVEESDGKIKVILEGETLDNFILVILKHLFELEQSSEHLYWHPNDRKESIKRLKGIKNLWKYYGFTDEMDHNSYDVDFENKIKDLISNSKKVLKSLKDN